MVSARAVSGTVRMIPGPSREPVVESLASKIFFLLQKYCWYLFHVISLFKTHNFRIHVVSFCSRFFLPYPRQWSAEHLLWCLVPPLVPLGQSEQFLVWELLRRCKPRPSPKSEHASRTKKNSWRPIPTNPSRKNGLNSGLGLRSQSLYVLRSASVLSWRTFSLWSTNIAQLGLFPSTWESATRNSLGNVISVISSTVSAGPSAAQKRLETKPSTAALYLCM